VPTRRVLGAGSHETRGRGGHRAILSDGTPGRYIGGIEAKRTLLTLEATA